MKKLSFSECVKELPDAILEATLSYLAADKMADMPAVQIDENNELFSTARGTMITTIMLELSRRNNEWMPFNDEVAFLKPTIKLEKVYPTNLEEANLFGAEAAIYCAIQAMCITVLAKNK